MPLSCCLRGVLRFYAGFYVDNLGGAPQYQLLNTFQEKKKKGKKKGRGAMTKK